MKLIRALGMGLGLTVGAAGAAVAQENASGFYFGVSGGQSQADVDQALLDDFTLFILDSIDAFVIDPSSSVDEEDTAWSIFAGYRLNPYIAFEAGYQDLGTASYQASGLMGLFGLPGLAPTTITYDFESSGITVAALGALPIGENFDLHGRLGMYFEDTELTFGINSGGFRDGASESESGEELYYGVGAGFRFADYWRISLDYQMFQDVGHEDLLGESDVDVISLSVSYSL